MAMVGMQAVAIDCYRLIMFCGGAVILLDRKIYKTIYIYIIF